MERGKGVATPADGRKRVATSKQLHSLVFKVVAIGDVSDCVSQGSMGN
jgi:hypothetical protein